MNIVEVSGILRYQENTTMLTTTASVVEMVNHHAWAKMGWAFATWRIARPKDPPKIVPIMCSNPTAATLQRPGLSQHNRPTTWGLPHSRQSNSKCKCSALNVIQFHNGMVLGEHVATALTSLLEW